MGLICLQVFEYNDSKAKDHALRLGVGMQLVNILRDLREDLDRNRIYIPLEEMAEFGYSESDFIEKKSNQQLESLLLFQVLRAREYLGNVKELVRYLPWRSRSCPKVLGGIYSKVLDKIQNNALAVMTDSVHLSKKEKVLTVMQAMI